MTRFEYHDFNPEDETSLLNALFRYGSAEIVEQVQALNKAGFYLKALGDSHGAPYSQLVKLTLQLSRQVKAQLQSGTLIAFGYTQDILAGPQLIPSNLWRHVWIDLKVSEIELKGRPETRMTTSSCSNDQCNSQTMLIGRRRPRTGQTSAEPT